MSYKRSRSKTLEIYNFINDYNLEHGFCPTIREIGSAVGLSSTSTVYNHVQKLIDYGYVSRNPTCSRTLMVNKEREGILFDFLDIHNFNYNIEKGKVVIDLK